MEYLTITTLHADTTTDERRAIAEQLNSECAKVRNEPETLDAILTLFTEEGPRQHGLCAACMETMKTDTLLRTYTCATCHEDIVEPVGENTTSQCPACQSKETLT